VTTALDPQARDATRPRRVAVRARQTALAIAAAGVTGLVMGLATAVAGRWS
jgi:hypothetical protein